VEDYVPDEKWDVILFNEVLYYTFDPVLVLSKFEKALTPGGTFVISMYKRRNLFAYNNRCIRRLQGYFHRAGYAILEAAEVKRLRELTAWQIFVVRPAKI